MTSPTVWALISVEIAFVLLGLLLYCWLSSRKLNHLDRQAMQDLVAKVKKGKAEREAAMRSLLSERFKLSGEALETSTVAMLHAELSLYQQFANLYANRDAGAAKGFNITLEAGLAPYWTLPEQQIDTSDVPAEPPTVDLEELERLKQENQDLRSELQVTMDTMTRMLDEYASQFSVGQEGEAEDGVTPAGDSALAAGVARMATAVDDGGATSVPPGLPDGAELTDEDSVAAMPVSNEQISEELTPELASDSGDHSADTGLDDTTVAFSEATVTEAEPSTEPQTEELDPAPPVSDADADALLADALGGADLSVDELDDLFDEEDIGEPRDGEPKAEHVDFDDGKSVSI